MNDIPISFIYLCSVLIRKCEHATMLNYDSKHGKHHT